MEPFPSFACYDENVPAIRQRLTSVPQKILQVLAEHDCDSQHVNAQRRTATALQEIPMTRKLRIGLLGDAGAGRWLSFSELGSHADN